MIIAAIIVMRSVMDQARIKLLRSSRPMVTGPQCVESARGRSGCPLPLASGSAQESAAMLIGISGRVPPRPDPGGIPCA